MKVIIVGGVAGGASAAARLRRLDEHAQIVIYERSGYISYANCGLPYYIGEVITDKTDLTLQTPESFYSRFRIEAKVKHEVVSVDVKAKTVTVRNLANGQTVQDGYDKLILSPGAKAIYPKITGVSGENIFTLRTVEDAFLIYEKAKNKGAKSAVVFGGGFIGLETAENFKRLGLDVTVVDAAPQILSLLDKDMALQVHTLFRKNGIKLVLNKGIAGFENGENTTICTLTDGDRIAADIVLLALGVVPDTKLTEGTGIELGAKGGIVVNDKMETSIPDIYAVGDAVEVEHYITGSKALIPLAGPANKQGRIAADNIAGGDSRYRGSQGTSIIKLFDMTVAATGINERQAKAAELDYEKIILSPASNASYYPGGKVMTVKVLFEKNTGRILGAQIVGYDGVDKRIDVLATAMRAGLDVGALSELELAYAPPYSSAKDPVNMVGFVAKNILSGKVKQFYYEDIKGLAQDDVALIDVRTPLEYAKGHAEGFVNIPVDDLRSRLNEVPGDKAVYVMCQSGIRSYIACRILTGRGYRCYNFAGGYRFYSMAEKERLESVACYSCGADK